MLPPRIYKHLLKDNILQNIVNKLYGNLSGKKLAILGFAFKADTNDTRESPAINICKYLIEEGSILNIYDPKVKKEQIQKDLNFEEFKYSNSILESVQDVDGIVILTDWEEFKNLKLLIGMMRLLEVDFLMIKMVFSLNMMVHIYML